MVFAHFLLHKFQSQPTSFIFAELSLEDAQFSTAICLMIRLWYVVIKAFWTLLFPISNLDVRWATHVSFLETDNHEWKNHSFNHVKSDTICGSLTPCIIYDTHVTQTYLYVMVCDVRQPHAIKRRYTTLLAVCASVSVVYINCIKLPWYLLVNLRSHAEEFARIVDYHAFSRTATCRWTDPYHYHSAI